MKNEEKELINNVIKGKEYLISNLMYQGGYLLKKFYNSLNGMIENFKVYLHQIFGKVI